MIQEVQHHGQLNLARKWRSKTFDEIIGQELSVKMLKNSLYKDYYFPVYLFFGQKGCGKTTTARVFAAAVNCELLSLFQKSPKDQSIPCLSCTSCQAFYTGRHPDFIEMDAASHTGVDNVRSIIDAASLLPLMGRKKIYLIDEAHMLSKAAFSAFLKILEEPPVSVIFILATTDAEKILETVRSRCFQVFFNPIETTQMLKHITNICVKEKIEYDQEALALIVKQGAGSVRDALNLLEQVRFVNKRATKATVQIILGYTDDQVIIELFSLVMHKNVENFLRFCQEKSLHCYSASYIWQMLIAIARVCLWFKYSVKPLQLIEHHTILKQIAEAVSLEDIRDLLECFYGNESVFFKTIDQYGLLELILVQLCQKRNTNTHSSSNAEVVPQNIKIMENRVLVETIDNNTEVGPLTRQFDSEEKKEDSMAWKMFLHDLECAEDPLVFSIFRQAEFKSFNKNNATLQVNFSKKFIFFKELFDQTGAVWKPLIERHFGLSTIFDALFDDTNEVLSQIITPEQKNKEIVVARVNQEIATVGSISRDSGNSKQNNGYKQTSSGFVGGRSGASKIYLGRAEIITNNIDTSNILDWPKTALLQQYFAGTIKELVK
jgi:DNA polymerase III subunit gamma/tau